MKKAICMVCVLAICLALAGCDSSQYKKATSLYEAGDYEAAASLFEELGDYENSAEMALACKYTFAAQLLENKDYDAAKEIFEKLGNYADSENFRKECDYQKAEDAFTSGDYETAISLYELNPAYLDSETKISDAKRALMYEKYGEVIEKMTEGVWFYNGGSDAAVNRLTFTNDQATVIQIVSDGNGTHSGNSNDLSFVVDETSIVLTLVDGSEQTIPYTLNDGTLALEGGYLTPAEVEADLQGYWGIHDKDTIAILGLATENEYIAYLNEGTFVYESAAKAYGGRNGEYYYYGPYEGTYQVNETGLKVEVRNNFRFAFNVIDGKAVLLSCGKPFSPVSGFKGEKGYRF